MRSKILALGFILVASPLFGQVIFGPIGTGGSSSGGGTNYVFDATQFTVGNTTNVAISSGAVLTNLSLKGTTLALGINNTGAITNSGVFTNGGAVTIAGGVTNFGAVETRGNTTNAGWLNIVGGFTNNNGMLTLGSITNGGRLETAGAVTNYSAVANLSTLTNAGAITFAGGLTNFAAVENRSTLTNAGAVTHAAGVTNFSSMETRGVVTNGAALLQAGAQTNYGALVINGATASSVATFDANKQVQSLATPNAPWYGYTLSSDGTNPVWSADANGQWVVNEEWDGDVTSTTTGQQGTHFWSVGSSGSSQGPIAPLSETVSVAFNYISCVTTQTTSGRVWYMGGNSPGLMSTNYEMFFISRTRIGQTNITGDITTHRIGLTSASVPTGEPNDGIYVTVNTNINTNTYVFVTSRAGTRTITYRDSHAANTNDGNSFKWMVTGFYLDRSGTNVIFYVGPSETNLTAVATNSSNIPNNNPVTPSFQVNRILSSGGTANRTNYCDWIRLWLRKI